MEQVGGASRRLGLTMGTWIGVVSRQGSRFDGPRRLPGSRLGCPGLGVRAPPGKPLAIVTRLQQRWDHGAVQQIRSYALAARPGSGVIDDEVYAHLRGIVAAHNVLERRRDDLAATTGDANQEPDHDEIRRLNKRLSATAGVAAAAQEYESVVEDLEGLALIEEQETDTEMLELIQVGLDHSPARPACAHLTKQYNRVLLFHRFLPST